MDSKEAATVLIELLGKYSLEGRDREAVRYAIGVLGLTMYAEKRIKNMGERRREAHDRKLPRRRL